jgi:hypothetical protein
LKVCLVTALWRRRLIAEACLDWHLSLVDELAAAGVELRLLCVASEPEDYLLARDRGWLCVKHDNQPLGKKFNKVMEAVPTVHGKDVEAVIVIGSDDYLTASYIRDACHLVREGTEYASAKTAYMVDGDGGRAIRFRGNVTIGGGRIVTAGLMRQCQWRPWEAGLRSGLDASFDRTLRIIEAARGEKIRFAVIENDGLMTIKSKENMWSYDFLAARIITEEVKGDAVYEMYPQVFDKTFHEGVD